MRVKGMSQEAAAFFMIFLRASNGPSQSLSSKYHTPKIASLHVIK
jgi:hypothetical protein